MSLPNPPHLVTGAPPTGVNNSMVSQAAVAPPPPAPAPAPAPCPSCHPARFCPYCSGGQPGNFIVNPGMGGMSAGYNMPVDPRAMMPQLPFPGMGGAMPGFNANFSLPGFQMPGMTMPALSMGGGYTTPQPAPAPSAEENKNNFKAAMDEINRQSRENWLNKAKQGGIWIVVIIVGFYLMQYLNGQLQLPSWLTGKPAESTPIGAGGGSFSLQYGAGQTAQQPAPAASDLVSLGGNIQVAYRENGTSLRYSVDHKNRTMLVFTPIDALTQAAMQQWQGAGYSVVIWQGANPASGIESPAVSSNGGSVPNGYASMVPSPPRTGASTPADNLTLPVTGNADVQKTADAWEKLRKYLANRPGRFVDYERKAIEDIITEGQGAARRASGEN